DPVDVPARPPGLVQQEAGRAADLEERPRRVRPGAGGPAQVPAGVAAVDRLVGDVVGVAGRVVAREVAGGEVRGGGRLLGEGVEVDALAPRAADVPVRAADEVEPVFPAVAEEAGDRGHRGATVPIATRGDEVRSRLGWTRPPSALRVA